jgi:type IV secretory pathway ATPase VirB11/archaellum biosynthesis ATPase
MLSAVDLIDASTLSIDVAAYCMAAIGKGASFMVGALPGGAGKTTVMGALLNFVPGEVQLRPADGIATIREGLEQSEPGCCYICHEIGKGAYYAYLWDAELRAYFELPASGHMLATNLHADTYEQARKQLCDDNGVAESLLRQVNLMLFLAVRRSVRGIHREISTVWESDGESDHRSVFSTDRAGFRPEESRLVRADDFAVARQRITAMRASGARTIEEVREALFS